MVQVGVYDYCEFVGWVVVVGILYCVYYEWVGVFQECFVGGLCGFGMWVGVY